MCTRHEIVEKYTRKGVQLCIQHFLRRARFLGNCLHTLRAYVNDKYENWWKERR